jgi:hypothetical protein
MNRFVLACGVVVMTVWPVGTAFGQGPGVPAGPGNVQAPVAPNAGQGVSPAPGAVLPGGVQGGQDQWRYRWHNGAWWYWTPANRWVVWNGSSWQPYTPSAGYNGGYGTPYGYPGYGYPSHGYGYPNSTYHGHGHHYHGHNHPGRGLGHYLGHGHYDDFGVGGFGHGNFWNGGHHHH